MKKIIYIVCGILIMGFIIEDINFIYAENVVDYTEIGGILDNDEEIFHNEGELSNDVGKSDNNGIEENKVENEESENNETGGNDNDESNDNEDEYDEIENDEGINDVNKDNINENDKEEVNITENSGNQYRILGEIDEQPGFDSNSDLDSSPEMVMQIMNTDQFITTSGYGIIRIKDPDHPGKGITIHDRNLGAAATGAGIDDTQQSFGYYFQWGNNYGFSLDSEINTTGVQVDASGYGPENPYSSDIFIKGNPDWTSVSNNNLRGGSGDSKANNNWGYPIENPSDRQGPCPENYHVPSIGEWNKLLEFWKLEYKGALTLYTGDYELHYFRNNSKAANAFYSRFNIPLAGGFNRNMSGIDGFYLSSSSPNNSYSSFRVYGNSEEVYIYGNNYRAFMFPIRCFYNSYRLPVKVTYDINGGYRTDGNISEHKIITYTRDDESDYSGDSVLGTVSKENNCGNDGNKKCMFAGWYNDNDEMWTGYISDDIMLYARWLEYNDKNISLSGVNFTIMDRNLGAIEEGVLENSYGYYLSGGENDILCPEGYHIPSTGEWKGIGNLLGSDFDGRLVKNLFDLPFAGKITSDGIIEDEGTGYYLAKNGDEFMYAKISNSAIDIENLDVGNKVSVRCFKDYNRGTIRFESNGGNNISDITTVNWREEGDELQKPKRDNSIFLGWYTSEGTKIEKNINYKNEEEISLYADWKCEEGYTKGKDRCNPIYLDITWIDGNENILKTDSVKWGELPVYTGDIPTKSPTIQYRYIFKNWLPKIVIATGNAIYTAQFNEELNEYTVTINSDSNSGSVSTGFIIQYYGTPISINGNKLTIGDITITATEKPADSQYTHTFSGWINNCGNELKENCTIDAEFISTVNKYNVTINADSNSGFVNTGFITHYYGTPISINGNKLTIGDTTIIATEKPANSQYTHTFSGWNNNCGNELKENCTIDAEFISTVNKYIITWIDGDNNILKTQEIPYGELPIYNGNVPTKKETQQYKYTFNNTWNPEIRIVTGTMVYTAQFNEELIKKSGGSSGGGGGGGKSSKNSANSNNSDKSINGQTGNNVSESIISTDSLNKVLEGEYNLLSGEKLDEPKGNNQNYLFENSEGINSLNYGDSEGNNIDGFTQEFIDAYNFAYKNKITTKSSIKDAKMYSPLTRIQMAKMLSNYAINVLGKQPDIMRGGIKFNDVPDKLDKEYGNGVTIAYQLGIMGQNIKSNNFRPYDTVTRAEFSTVLSRLLFGIEDGENMYYEPHIEKLNREGIISNLTPTLIEKRGYVMLMLMRGI